MSKPCTSGTDCDRTEFCPAAPPQVCTACSKNCTFCTDLEFCVSCRNGFLLVGGICHACPSNCTTCRTIGVCFVCNASTQLVDGQCIPIPSICSTENPCPKGLHCAGTTCVRCPVTCAACSSATKCTECKVYAEMSTAQACIEKCTQGFNQTCVNGSSVNCGITGQVTQCNCSLIALNCKTCAPVTGSNTDPSACEECMEGYSIDSGSCTNCTDGFDKVGKLCLPQGQGDDDDIVKGGISGGAIAGIAVGSILVIGIAVGTVCYFLKRKSRFAQNQTQAVKDTTMDTVFGGQTVMRSQ
ncbi:Cysteine-rich membrane protein 2 [Spironucleus salmonicida]|uniref:Cysteine-rich membrane protein 2 n=1 Tax=Spironucleus salmonicida TaxID=348837 RepID=V6LXT5_9EUKA|nr:Cysteine-rich membrane protein 2 [Spironucleus salmonicida]|eukprot:EST45624.1 Cysteine-rich membrane protein 2 [Spironucleus salmonicida]